MKIICALLFVALLVPASADASARKPCALRHGEKVVKKSKRAIVTRVEDRYTDRYTGCRLSTGRRHVLIELGDISENVSHFVLAGDKLAFAYTSGNHNGIYRTEIRVIDTRRWRHARWADGPRNDESEGATLERLALSPRGWVAWRWRLDRYGPGGPFSTQMIDMNEGDGTYRLDSAEGGSLRGPRFATPSRVAWAHDGVELSAQAAAASGRPCALRYGERLVVGSRRVWVTMLGGAWYGCRLKDGRHIELAEDSDARDVRRRASRFTIAGDYVAFVDEGTTSWGEKSVIIRGFDSRTWRPRDPIFVSDTSGPSELDSVTIDELALSRQGWVAWRARYEHPDPSREAHEESIDLHDGAGTRVLDSGAIGSLTGPRFSSPTHVEWSHDSRLLSADAQP